MTLRVERPASVRMIKVIGLMFLVLQALVTLCAMKLCWRASIVGRDRGRAVRSVRKGHLGGCFFLVILRNQGSLARSCSHQVVLQLELLDPACCECRMALRAR